MTRALAVILAPGLAAAQPATKLRVMTPTEVLEKVDGTYASAKQVSYRAAAGELCFQLTPPSATVGQRADSSRSAVATTVAIG